MSHKITKPEELSSVLGIEAPTTKNLQPVLQLFDMEVSPHLALQIKRLIAAGNERYARSVLRTVMPDIREHQLAGTSIRDGMGEEYKVFEGEPVPSAVSRLYPDRVLIFLFHKCPVLCRYCFRRRKVNNPAMRPSGDELQEAIEYIRRDERIRDVILSGGDPLTFDDGRLEAILRELRAIPHVDFIRIDTKYPVAIPQRITPELVAMLRQFHPLFMTLHFTHPGELSPETKRACEMLADAGIQLGTYTPLLRGVNDDREVLKELFLGLLRVRVKPYYLVQFVETDGAQHFKTHIEKGLELLDGMHGEISGYALPQYIVWLPGGKGDNGEKLGGGKVPVQLMYGERRTQEGYVFRDYKGRKRFYPDPMADQ